MIRTLTAAALAVSVAVTPAFAASDDFRMEVQYDPAKLETAEKAAVEYERIREDVHNRCVKENAAMVTSFLEARATAYCEQKLMRKIVARIDNPNLTAAHNAAG